MASFLEKILILTETEKDKFGNEHFVFNERQALHMIKAFTLEEKHKENMSKN